MADIELRVVGTVVRTPELRFTSGGQAVCDLTVVTNHRTKGDDGKWTNAGDGVFTNCTVWGKLAENVAASVDKGDRVVVYGRQEASKFAGRDGQTVERVKLVADEVAVSLKFATVTVERTERTQVRGEPGYRDEEAL